jgi:hypothetical protein
VRRPLCLFKLRNWCQHRRRLQDSVFLLRDARWTDVHGQQRAQRAFTMAQTVMEIAEAIAPQLRGHYLKRIAADLRHRCDRDGVVSDGDVYRAAITARSAVVPKARAISGL